MYAASRGPRPVSLGASLLISGGIITALVFLNPKFEKKIYDTTGGVIVRPEVIPPPEPPPPTDRKPETPRESTVFTPDPVVPTPPQPDPIRTTSDPIQPPPPPFLGKAEGTGEAVVTPPSPPLPPLIAAQADPRYAGDIQPPYPAARERAGDEGNVRVRIRIGTDGRVKEVVQLSATHSDFWEATRRHVLAKWRFKPATRGGVPEESWKVMSLKFEIKA